MRGTAFPLMYFQFSVIVSQLAKYSKDETVCFAKWRHRIMGRVPLGVCECLASCVLIRRFTVPNRRSGDCCSVLPVARRKRSTLYFSHWAFPDWRNALTNKRWVGARLGSKIIKIITYHTWTVIVASWYIQSSQSLPVVVLFPALQSALSACLILSHKLE